MDIYAAVTDRIIAEIERDTLQATFIDITCRLFSEMRLMAEGAISIYEDDAQPLCRLTQDADNTTALSTLDDIGTALYALRANIRQLQEAHHKELRRQMNAHIRS